MLNNLIQDNKAIVTEVAGTTRDVLEEYVNVRGTIKISRYCRYS